MAEPHGQLMRYKKRRRRPSLFLRLRGGRCPGGEQVLRLRARDGAFRAPARVTFFFCKKKVTKENHSNLRFKDPWRGEGKCKFGGADLAELVRWVTLLSVQGSLVPLAPLPLTAVRVGVGALVEWRLSNRAHCGAKHRNG